MKYIHNKIILKNKEFKVEPKVMEVLCFLVQEQGKVLSREHIAETLWPNKVVSLEVVTRAIFELRRILNDDVKEPKYIETIARKGYCFIYKVEKELTESMPKRLEPGVSKIAILCVLTLVLLFMLSRLFIDSSSKLLEVDSSLIHTRSNMYQSSPNISPNGQYLVYAEGSKQNDRTKSLVLQDLKTHEQRSILNQKGNYYSPVWEPTGNFVFYLNCKETGCDVNKVGADGANSELIYSATKFIFELAISPDGNILAFNYKEGLAFNIALLELATGTVKSIDLSQGYHLNPVFSNDGKALWFTTEFKDRSSILNSYDLATEEVKEVKTGFHTVAGLAVANDSGLWVSGKKGGKSGIWHVDLSRNKSERLLVSNQGSYPTHLDTHPKNQQLIYRSWVRDTKINHSGLSLNLELINDEGIDIRALYSPKQNSLYWISNRSGSFDLWKYSNNKASKLTDLNSNSIKQPILSNDESRLAFLEKGQDHSHLYIYDFSTSETQRIMDWPYQGELVGWGKNNSEIWVSIHENTQNVLAVLDVTSKKLNRKKIGAGVIAVVSNGEFYFIDISKQSLMKESELGEVEIIADLTAYEPFLESGTIAIQQTSVYFISQQGNEQKLVSFNWSTKTFSQHLDIPAEAIATDVGVEPQPYVIFDKLVRDETNLVLVKIKDS
jgi:DNA-binding winged helix-turn-helix (wHTH) protein/Tol biopolymer transport system component